LVDYDSGYDPQWASDLNKTQGSEWGWRVEEFEDVNGIYVDLRINDESYTGYKGG
jgi:hypothetical protein